LAVSDESLKTETARRVSMVSLYRAFGEGWDTAAINQIEEGNVLE